MNSSTITNNIKALIDEFILIQNELIETFKQSFPDIKDIQYLSDCPREGEIKIGGEKWHFQRHGIGICFTEKKSGKVVDIHTGIFNNKIVLDSWGLIQYFESLNLTNIEYKNKIFNLENENDIKKIISLWGYFYDHYSNGYDKLKKEQLICYLKYGKI